MIPCNVSRDNLVKTLGVVFDGDKIQNSNQIAHKFFFSNKEALLQAIDAIEPEPWPTPDKQRQMRATGRALELTMQLTEFAGLFYGMRLVLFTGGPCTIGPGMTADLDISVLIRKHNEIETNGRQRDMSLTASSFYRGLTNKAILHRITVDIFAFSLDEFGFYEMNTLTTKTGGISIMNEEFKQEHFGESLQHYFKRDEAGNIALGSFGLLDMHLSRELRVEGCLGNCASLENKSTLQSTNEIGECKTNTWFLGGVDHQSTLLFFFGLADKSPNPKTQQAPNAYIQLVIQYKLNGLPLTKRIVTFERPFISTNSPS